MKGIFVTGTDTGCGKTEVGLGLICALRARGLSVQAMKPVASGCVRGADGPINEDARRLRAQASREAPYEWVNPYAFEPAIAPHIAAGQAGIGIELSVIRQRAEVLSANADCLLVEGVGGWRVPLAPRLFVSDLPRELGLPVLMIAGLRLGCINHSLMTVEGIHTSGCRLVGWVANRVDPKMDVQQENLATLTALIDAPFLGLVPWMPTPEPQRVARYLKVDAMLPEFLSTGNGS